MDETLRQILDHVQGSEDHLGILLAAQLGGTPREIQLIMQTATMDENHEQLSPQGQYIIRCVGVAEHELSLGLFANMVHSTDNALLYPHNDQPVQVHFEGKPNNADTMMIELNQLYGQTYGMYGPFKRMAQEINPTAPLSTLLNSGNGLLGVMPFPFAQMVKTLFERNNMTVNMVMVESDEEHHAPIKHQALVLDNTFIVAQVFSADPMGQ